MATCTSVGSGNFNVAGTWDAAPAVGDNIVIAAGHTVTLTANETVTYGTITIAATGVLDYATFNLTSGAITAEGTHKMGTSAGTGCTCTSYTFATGSTRDWANDSKINTTGNITYAATMTITGVKGILTINGACTYNTNGNTSATHYQLFQNAKITTAGVRADITTNASSTVTLNAEIDISSCTIGFVIGCATATFTLGTGFFLTGGASSVFFVWLTTGATFVDNSTISGGFSGTTTCTSSVSHDIFCPKAPSQKILIGVSTSGTYRIKNIGTVTAASFNYVTGVNTYTFDNSAYNTSFLISGAISFVATGGTSVYTKGAELWTLNDGNSNINFDSKTINNLTINATGTKTLTGAVTCNACTVTAGTYAGGGFLTTGSGAFTLGASGKLITANTNGLIHAAGMLTGFSSYTWTDGCTIEAQGSTTWDGTTFPSSANINYILNGSAKTFTQSANYLAKTITVTLGTHDISTYNCTVSGDYNFSGTCKIGISANTGLTCFSFTGVTGCTRSFNSTTTSKVNLTGGDYFLPATLSDVALRGLITFVESGGYSTTSSNSYCAILVVNVGKTCTILKNLVLNYTTTYGITLNGTLVNNFITTIGGNCTIGANGDFSGSGTLKFFSNSSDPALLTSSKIGAHSFTGTATIHETDVGSVDSFPAWDWSNATVKITGTATNDANITIGPAGDLKCKVLTVVAVVEKNVIITNLANIYCTGNVTYTMARVTWNKNATGYIYLTDGDGTINFGGASVEAIVKSGSGIKSIAADFTTVSITGGGGTINSSVAGTQRTITTALGSYRMPKTSFKDIAIVNGVITTTGKNLGNNATVGTTLIFKRSGLILLDKEITFGKEPKMIDKIERAAGTPAASATTNITMADAQPATVVYVENNGSTNLTCTYNDDALTTVTLIPTDVLFESLLIYKITIVNTSGTTAGSYKITMGRDNKTVKHAVG